MLNLLNVDFFEVYCKTKKIPKIVCKKSTFRLCKIIPRSDNKIRDRVFNLNTDIPRFMGHGQFCF